MSKQEERLNERIREKTLNLKDAINIVEDWGGIKPILILEKLGHDPAKAFDEMTKLLFLKVYDEREVPNFYEFVVLANEKPHDVADRVRELFDTAISSSKYQDVFWSQFNTVPVPVTLELDDFSIFNAVANNLVSFLVDFITCPSSLITSAAFLILPLFI